MDIIELKRQYNELIAREHKAQNYLNNNETPIEKIENWIPEYQNIIRQLSCLMKNYRELTGKEMIGEQVLNGFNF